MQDIRGSVCLFSVSSSCFNRCESFIYFIFVKIIFCENFIFVEIIFFLRKFLVLRFFYYAWGRFYLGMKIRFKIMEFIFFGIFRYVFIFKYGEKFELHRLKINLLITWYHNFIIDYTTFCNMVVGIIILNYLNLKR